MAKFVVSFLFQFFPPLAKSFKNRASYVCEIEEMLQLQVHSLIGTSVIRIKRWPN